MKYKKNIWGVIFIMFFISCSKNEKSILKSNKKKVQVKVINKSRIYNWNLNKELNPDENHITIRNRESVNVMYVSDIDSIMFNVKEETKINFNIVVAKDTFKQQILGVPYIPKANYSKEFKANKNGSIDFSVSELYELVNVIVALTDKGINDKERVNKNTEYYKSVLNHFSTYRNHNVVRKFNKFINQKNDYFLRTNGLTYNLGYGNKITKSNQYNRAVYNDKSPNYLSPYIEDLQDFAKRTNFKSFYLINKEYYNSVVAEIKNKIDIPNMLLWLQKNFPEIKYEYHNIVISPLTGNTQGIIMYENNNFKELQIHIGLPHVYNNKMSKLSEHIVKGDIIFSELNHGYLNKEADKYLEEINNALNSKRNLLVTSKYGKGYYGRSSELFKEYMNWGLVALRYVDNCPKEDLKMLMERNIIYMKDKRGFKMFDEFQNYLVSLYQNLDGKETIADLYPQIIQWFSKQ
ncbi:hypothetical protein LPB136_04360 [Tenacibaculum todarodis]|uniref:DUF4932 domain-containing protein n=1 Tax=Tenacibaculum todarodis TaxID=1850252 RepID=A0A1L3JHN0_9FLAO|nr:DUF4932 domain-containing protein [Tenacibaculum todarodis]APG64645.1 hypothetical protein LPB136_04360 [Tenacibaculum todarodis]